MNAILQQHHYNPFDFRSDFDRPEFCPYTGRTLFWHSTRFYPSPPMSSTPSPSQRKSSFSSALYPANSTQAPPATSSAPVQGDISISNTTVSSDIPAYALQQQTSGPLSQSLPSSTAAWTLPHRQSSSSSSNESLGLHRTESSSSTGNVADLQATTGPSTSTLGLSRGGRRAKAHVANACGNCKRAHLSCDVDRPCGRCVATGKADTCRDVPHKKRGRPRLRDEAEFRVQPVVPSLPSVGETDPNQQSVSARSLTANRHRRTGSLRTLRAHAADTILSSPSIGTPSIPGVLMPSPQTAFQPFPRSYLPLQPPTIPTAFLDLDLVITKANTSFQQLIRGMEEIRGIRLSEFAKPLEGDSFQNTRNRLREEREVKEPSYLPPILQPGLDPVSGLNENDIDDVTRGFDDQHYTWTFRLANGTEQTLPVRLRLGKTSVYFVVLFLPPLPQAQSEQIQRPAPPQTIYSGQPSVPIFSTASQHPGLSRSSHSVPSNFFHQQGYTPALPPPPQLAGPQAASRTFPPPEQQRPYPQAPQHQHRRSQSSIFQSPMPLISGQRDLPPMLERPPTAGSGSGPPSYLPQFPPARPRSNTMDSMAAHIQYRLRADSGATMAPTGVMSSPSQQYLQQPQDPGAPDRTSSSESAGSAASPRKRRKIGIDEVVHK